MQLPSERLSVVVMHNFETSPVAPAEHVVKTLLKFEEPGPKVTSLPSTWKGDFFDEDTHLYIGVEEGDRAKPGTISVSYGPGTAGETARLTSETEAETDGMKLTLEGDVLHVDRIDDNRKLCASRLEVVDKKDVGQLSSEDVVGVYRNEECDSVFTVSGTGGHLYGAFDGFLGQGPIWTMRQIGKNKIWALGNPRGLDATPPGDWTVVFKDEDKGKCSKVVVGCWLARKVEYVRQE
jgi:hypothetical protein